MTALEAKGTIDKNGFLQLETPLQYRNQNVKLIILIEEDNESQELKKRTGFGTWKGMRISEDFDASLDDLKDYMI